MQTTETPEINKSIRDGVKEYYGETLGGSEDLKTSACCLSEDMPAYQKEILSNIEDEVLAKFYGCGSPVPPAVEGMKVLDLGCGTGRDVYLFSKLVGPSGKVIGVDMTDEQLEVAKRNLPSQMKRFGFDQPNVEFKKGYIEDLKALGIEDNSLDVVVSNCVINLSLDKERVFSEIFRVLKPGGELYFSDVFSASRIPDVLRQDKVLYGECLSGAMYIEDFRRMVTKLGCPDYRVVSKGPIDLKTQEVKDKIGMIEFYSLTVRLFKLESMEDICEDYGQALVYKGTIPHHPHSFSLDDHHLFKKGKPLLVCGNTFSMIAESRLNKHFELVGDRSSHYGAFDCDTPGEKSSGPEGSCC